MKKWKARWKELLPYEKKFAVAAYVMLAVFLIVFTFEVLDKFGIISVGIDLFIVFGGVLAIGQGCEAVVCWRKERNLAYIFMMAAIVFGFGAVWDVVKLFIF